MHPPHVTSETETPDRRSITAALRPYLERQTTLEAIFEKQTTLAELICIFPEAAYWCDSFLSSREFKIMVLSVMRLPPDNFLL